MLLCAHALGPALLQTVQESVAVAEAAYARHGVLFK
jgi:hypothetical protein